MREKIILVRGGEIIITGATDSLFLEIEGIIIYFEVTEYVINILISKENRIVINFSKKN